MSLTQHISLYTLIYMTKEERHNLILETLIRHESIPVSSLSLLLDVSAVTIRKDLTDVHLQPALKAGITGPAFPDPELSETVRRM